MDTHSQSIPDPHVKAIAELNDTFRRTLIGGRFHLTPGIAALPASNALKILEMVRDFDAFTEKNDPHGEHDFGAFEFNGQTIFWKIDYYDAAFEYHAEDKADPTKSNRVLTIMLAEEY